VRQSDDWNFFSKRYDKVTKKIYRKVSKAVKGECYVIHSAYKTDEDGTPIDNLSEIAAPGRCIFVDDGSDFFGSGRSYRSKVYENPTWLDVCVAANEMIVATEDKHHIFLEGIESVGNNEYKLLMGS